MKILIVEDSKEDIELIIRELTRGGVEFISVAVHEKTGFERALLEFEPDVVICDHSLPQFDSIEALDLCKQYTKQFGRPLPFILVSGSVSEEFAVQIIQTGADDYVLKDRLKRLPSSVRIAFQKSKIENEKQKAEMENMKFLKVLQQSLNEIYIFDTSTLLLEYVNDGALRNLGYSAKEISGLRLIDIQQESAKDVFKELQRTIEFSDAEKWIYETVHIRKDNTLYNAEVHLQLVVQEKQRFFLAIAIDITERKKHLSAIEFQNKKLREIAWIQSHGIRAPVARIMGLINLIVEYKNITPNLEEILGYIKRSAQELDEIIKKIVRKTEDIETKP
jgi:PAS domain S-box-containing protein